jgi:hypothetical protein
MFAEDEGLLRARHVHRPARQGGRRPGARRQPPDRPVHRHADGGDYGDETIAWFNGGLFQTVDVPPLQKADVAALHRAADMDWRNIDPSIFGTLFERGLNPGQALAARRPLHRPGHHHAPRRAGRRAPAQPPNGRRPRRASPPLLAKSKKRATRRIKRRRRDVPRLPRTPAQLPRARPGLRQRQFPLSRAQGAEGSGAPRQRRGRGAWPAAAGQHRSLARQRARASNSTLRGGTRPRHGLDRRDSMDAAQRLPRRDAADPAAARHHREPGRAGESQRWRHGERRPSGRMRRDRRQSAVSRRQGDARPAWATNTPTHCAACYEGRVPGGADLVTYWFEKARAQIEAGKCKAAGLVATNSIRGGANRKVLDRIVASGRESSRRGATSRGSTKVPPCVCRWCASERLTL